MSVSPNQKLRVEEYEFPLDRKYYKNRDAHLWVRDAGDHVEIGLDGFMAETAGHLNYLEVTAEELEEGESFGHFESAKFVSKLYAPVSGEVLEVNDAVERNPRAVNDDPYGTWIARVDAAAEADDLTGDADEVESWIRDEIESLDG